METNKPFYDKQGANVMKLFGRLLSSKGTYTPVEFTGVVLQYEANGAFYMGIGVYQDISGRNEDTDEVSRKRLEELTRRIEARLLEIKRRYHLFNPLYISTPEPISITDFAHVPKIHIINTEQLAIKMKHGVEVQRLLHNYSSLKEAVPPMPEKNNPAAGLRDVTFINKVIEAVESHISNPAFTTDDLAEELNVSRTQLHRRIKVASGISSAEFIRRVRLERAAMLLAAEHLSVAEVAYQVGFDDSSYFSKCFRRQYAITPSEYRKKGLPAT